MNVTMVLTAMVNSGGSALVVFVADSSYCGGDRFEDQFFWQRGPSHILYFRYVIEYVTDSEEDDAD